MRRFMRWWVAAAAILVGIGPASAQSVVRGPYLQLGTPTGVVVRWRTNVATNSRVAFGPSPTVLGSFADVPASVTNHVVPLTGLLPGTRYFYSAGTTAAVLAGGDSAHFFDTPPATGNPAPTRIWVLGDSGIASVDARKVRDAYYAFTGARHTDLWLMLGDNAYLNGSDADFQTGMFQNKYEAMLRKSVVWPAFGNHDGLSANSATQTGPYYDIFTLPTAGEAGGVASGTEAYYSFDHANIHFICLDSAESANTPGSPMLVWLAADLALTTQRWRIAFWHHPPYSKGPHDSDVEAELIAMRQNVVPVLEASGVDLVMTGHSHTYERSFLMDGHYGDSTTLGPASVVDGGDGRLGGGGAYKKPLPSQTPHAGAVYVVAGSSGWVVTTSPLNHPAMIESFAVMGSLVIDVNGDQLDVRFIDKVGAVLDAFTMVKGPSTPVVTSHVLVPVGSTFKYHDLGSDLGTAWRMPSYDDAAWSSGPAPLGFGESYIATSVSWGADPASKHPTTYFRHTFTLPLDSDLVTSLRLRARYDDGFVAWLNGVEVARSAGLPAGPVLYGALAPSHEASAFELFAFPPGALVAGLNVLAIEVHQSSGNSDDLVLDVAVDADAFAPWLSACAAGNAGPLGAGADVVHLNGSAGGAGRSVDLASTTPIVLSVTPPPGAVTANFALFGTGGTPGPQDQFALPLGIGEMCFTPWILGMSGFFLASSFGPDPAVLVAATPAPWTFTTSSPVPPGFVATIQGVITDASGAFRVTNALRINVIP